MLTPSNRLLFWAGMLLPFLAVMAAVPSVVGVLVLFAVGLTLVSAVDALIGCRILHGVAVAGQDIVRLSKDQEGAIPVRITVPVGLPSIEMGMPFSEEVGTESHEMAVAIPEGCTDVSVEWKCCPTARGVYPVDACYVRVMSPLGFWKARGKMECLSEIRVYPNMVRERNRMASVFLNRGGVGMHSQRMVGQGRDFEKLRDYIPGDSYDEIHWKATAKRGRPITKMFQVERTQEIYVVIDSSRLSARKVGDDTLLERYLTSALVMGLAAERQGDLFGLIAFDSKVRRFIRASGGRAHFDACRDAIYTMQSSIVTPDYRELATFLRLRLRKRALLLVLTDLSDPMLAESFIGSTALVQRQHMILVYMITPNGVEPIFLKPDMAEGENLYDRLTGHIAWRNILETRKSLQRKGAELSMVSNEKLCAEMVSQYMNVKSRQAL